ncbi:hypothetical protein GCM10010123_09890 [Pilimelia anulata]|uniref:Protein-glutamate methylesterase/protein-glutamine glutaminase n=1 Tax=Pilimelia anulata TaxID=53371 RepID=A0A8J3B0C9_9ACTN|nr:chemotaxis-specific protein-glutamate methyltransferase CheB [Pilimelia anulata]GGJ82189.1 hypothetical protein GCM10010123_09890 [Pilimelia anulata]
MISVLVVDDSVVVRRLIQDALAGAGDIEVVGTAPNGRRSIEQVAALRPDVVTMDIEMPEMNGIEAVRELRRAGERVPVIMFSTLTANGASATLDALSAGATDYVTKPANTGSVNASIAAVREQLVPRIRALGSRGAARRGAAGAAAPLAPAAPTAAAPTAAAPAAPARPAPPTRPTPPARPANPAPAAALPARPAARPADRDRQPPTSQRDGRVPGLTHRPVVAAARAVPRPGIGTGRVDVLAIGSSTGGPDALARVLAALPAGLPVPVVVVQHMPPVFTTMFADRLDRTVALAVREAAADTPLRPGHVYIAPGDRHLEVVRRGTEVVTRLTEAPPENSCRPAVDVLFRSVAATYGRGTLATVLTGMGHDGRAGADVLHRAGAEIVVQDEQSSVVWGMPGAVAEAGLADSIKPLAAIGGYLAGRAGAGRAAAGTAR